MGFVKRNLKLELYLDSIGVVWNSLTDQEYKEVVLAVDLMLQGSNIRHVSGDDAFQALTEKLPLTGYIYSVPKHNLLALQGTKSVTFGYSASSLVTIDRSRLNSIECVVSDKGISFACVLNHEWQGYCPETYFENRT